MNLFVLDEDPVLAARYQCDKHVVKMIVETAQLLSTAHRLIDGKLQVVDYVNTKTGKTRKAKRWVLEDGDLNLRLYKATHVNHPSNVWVRETEGNYNWTYRHFLALCGEYEYRYGKKHASYVKLFADVFFAPARIKKGDRTQFALAMKSAPECMHPEDPVRSYREYYHVKQSVFKMKWTKREVPSWFKQSYNPHA